MSRAGVICALLSTLLWDPFTAGRAAAVSVTVATAAAIPIEDAVVMFDPVGPAPAAAAATVVVDQINRRFVPHVTVVQKGAAISFPNSDHIRHQVYSFSPAKTFNLKLYAGSPRMSVTFDQPGLVVLGCNIHDSMVGFIAVADSPYFGKSGADGTVRLDLPPGSYRMRVWQAELAAPIAPKLVNVASDALTIPVQTALNHGAAAPAAWP